ncbi:hypothetical protein HDU87_002250 [Geranomyces variabilis]|uniref:Phytase-like domain-containing protein n=1 Tax=Geranomyces variabilis TaxID=109894 RepID=A0AAD5TLK4_9FUNG|nr:hypothetical protein HDU87_002250 [Geranomyces variabilis]
MRLFSVLSTLLAPAAVLGAVVPPVHARPADCSGTSLYDRLPSKFEPSDLAFDHKTSTLYIVSDNGQLGALTEVDSDNGPDATVYVLGKQFDLEGSTLVPSRPGFIYLGNEYPAAIVEYELASSQVTRQWALQPFFDDSPTPKASKNSGLESLVFRQTNGSLTTFYVGRQADARVFVVNIALDEKSTTDVILVGTLDPPGPGIDLSSMTIFRDLLWLLYDKREQALALPLAAATIPPDATGTVDDTGAASEEVGTLEFTTRGQEGLAFVELADGQKFVFVGVDPPKHKGDKDLRRYDFDTFFECFSQNGAPPAPLVTA